MKKLLYILPLLILVSCGPSRKQIEAQLKLQADSISGVEVGEPVEPVEPVKEECKIKKYFIANDFKLTTGTVLDFTPSNEEVLTWECAGGTVKDRKIYIHIQDYSGMVTVMECDHRVWLNLYPGDVLK